MKLKHKIKRRWIEFCAKQLFHNVRLAGSQTASGPCGSLYVSCRDYALPGDIGGVAVHSRQKEYPVLYMKINK